MSSFTQSFLQNGLGRQHEPFGISVLRFAAGRMIEDTLLPSCLSAVNPLWRSSMTFATFKNKGEQVHGELSLLTNLPEGSLARLESLADFCDSFLDLVRSSVHCLVVPTSGW